MRKDAIAMAEFLHYIKKFDQVYIDKIPRKFMEMLKENYDKEHICEFDYNKPLKELSLTAETHALINLVCYKYWCENDEQRKALKEKWQENSDIIEKELREKYNPDNIFKNNKYIKNDINNEDINNKENKSLIEYNSLKWYQKVFYKIKKIFMRKK